MTDVVTTLVVATIGGAVGYALALWQYWRPRCTFVKLMGRCLSNAWPVCTAGCCRYHCARRCDCRPDAFP